MLVLHGFADEAPLLELAARVAAGGATNLRDALRHLHSEIRFRFKDIAEADPARWGRFIVSCNE